MTEREQIAWLYRRVGFGLGPGELDNAEARGLSAELSRLLYPERNGIAEVSSPWDLADYQQEPNGELVRAATTEWLDGLQHSTQPLQEWMSWFWHGHLVTGLNKVRAPRLIISQIDMFRELGLSNLRDLLYATSIDGAMLGYLDGRTSTREAPNENYGRELMELFTLGIGNYTEDDVKAAAAALTGWTINRDDQSSVFIQRRHDSTPQTFLGKTGVNSVEDVVDAILAHDACAPFITSALTKAICGAQFPRDLAAKVASDFRNSGYEIRALVAAILEAALTDNELVAPIVTAPVPWLISAKKALESSVEAPRQLGALNISGQLPLSPPNVAGWPGGKAWLSAATVTGRFGLASSLATNTPMTNPAYQAADAAELSLLADALGRPEGFSEATESAIASLGNGRAVESLIVAITAPDFVVA